MKMWIFRKNRSLKFKIIKSIVILLFILTSSLFFSLTLTFARCSWRMTFGEDSTPEPIPLRKSIFGVDLLKWDGTPDSRGNIPPYIIRGIFAGILTIILEMIGMTGICNDGSRLTTAFAIMMTLIVVITGILVIIVGSPILDPKFALIACSVIAIVVFAFSVFIKREKMNQMNRY